LGFITDDDITVCCRAQYGVPSINLKYYEIDPNGHSPYPAGYGAALSSRAVVARRLRADDCDDRSDKRFRDGRREFMTGLTSNRLSRPKRPLPRRFRAAMRHATNGEETHQFDEISLQKTRNSTLAADEAELDAAALERAADEAPIIKLVN